MRITKLIKVIIIIIIMIIILLLLVIIDSKFDNSNDNHIIKGWCPTGVQGSPSELNFFTTYGGIEPRTLRSSQILS
jgi:L-asparagine transporter-like permease